MESGISYTFELRLVGGETIREMFTQEQVCSRLGLQGRDSECGLHPSRPLLLPLAGCRISVIVWYLRALVSGVVQMEIFTFPIFKQIIGRGINLYPRHPPGVQ